MSWNQSDKKQQDSWGRSSNEQPPDLTELFKKMSGGFATGKGSVFGSFSPFFLLAILLLLWVLSGIYIITEGQRGVELRFGAYAETTLPGPHWHIPYPIETVEKVDVDRIRSAQNKSSMLTQDENIVEVELAVQYRIKDASDYLFNIRFPDTEGVADQARGTLFQVMESALREVVGRSKMDFILGAGRAEIAANIKNTMTDILDGYKSGMEVVTVNLQQSQPPEAVQGAFADAIKAREDQVRFVNEAEAYANGVLPKARGDAARMVQAANAYYDKVVNNSAGEADRFSQLYEEYRKMPDVTRRRLYLEAVESVLSRTNKVIVDVDKGSNVFYLPLDRIVKDATRFRSLTEDEDYAGTGGSNAAGDSGGSLQDKLLGTQKRSGRFSRGNNAN